MTPLARPSRLRGWWRRIFGRPATASQTVPPAATAVAQPEVTAPPAAAVPVTATPPSAKPVPEPMPVREDEPVDPALRARTLEALAQLQQIPSLQSLAQGFKRVAARSDGSIDELVEAVQKDPALCVRVLRMANSTFVASERRIEDVPTAVQMLGLRRVSTLAHVLFTMRDARHVTNGLDWRHLWIHNLATAAIAEELERQLGLTPSPQVYLAALLHDVGKIVLSTVLPDAYATVLAEVWNKGERLDRLERRHLGVTHAEAGVRFATECGLPAEVVAAIEHHATPAGATAHPTSVAVVSLANFLSKFYGLGFSGARLDETDGDLESQPAWALLAADGSSRPDISSVDDGIRGFVAALKPTLQSLRE